MNSEMPDGIYLTRITPYTPNGGIDYDGLQELINGHQGKGDRAVRVCASNGMFALSRMERLKLMSFAVQNAPKDMRPEKNRTHAFILGICDNLFMPEQSEHGH